MQINDNFAKLSEALYISEQKAREAVEMRSKIQREIMAKEKAKKEAELRELAQRARMERAGGVAAAAGAGMAARVDAAVAVADDRCAHWSCCQHDLTFSQMQVLRLLLSCCFILHCDTQKQAHLPWFRAVFFFFLEVDVSVPALQMCVNVCCRAGLCSGVTEKLEWQKTCVLVNNSCIARRRR